MSYRKDIEYAKTEKKRIMAKLGRMRQDCIDEKRDPNPGERAAAQALLREVDALDWHLEAEPEINHVDKKPSEYVTPVDTRKDKKIMDTEKRFSTLGEQLQAVIAASSPGGRADKRLFRAASGLSEAVPSEGGFSVQTDFHTEILKAAYDKSVLAAKCKKIQISGPSNSLKIAAIDETTRANGSRWGGIQTYWTAEAAAFTDSKPKLRQLELSLKKLTGLCYLTEELCQDAPALEQVVKDAFASEISFVLDDMILRGSGAGQPLGVLTSGAVVTESKEAGQAATTIVAENVEKMYSRLYPAGHNSESTIWIVNQECWPQIFQFHHSVGTGGTGVFVPGGSIAGQPYNTLFGKPIATMEQCSALGTAGDIMLMDLSQYLLVEKGGLAIDQSLHVRFLYDERTLRFRYRVDGQPLWEAAVTPYKGSSDLSAFVSLETRS